MPHGATCLAVVATVDTTRSNAGAPVCDGLRLLLFAAVALATIPVSPQATPRGMELSVDHGFFGLFATALIAAIAVHAMHSALTDDGNCISRVVAQAV
jgi:hypothetical protein